MFYEIKLRQYIRVPPTLFELDTKTAILKELNENFTKSITKSIGLVIAILEIKEVGDGIIIPGDGAPYYDTVFTVLAFKPELQEVVHGIVTDITEFGAFMSIGPLDGMIHIGQAMDDFVSYNKSGSLTGKETKRVLKVKDVCKARIVAASYKNVEDPKIGLTMRQPGLGKDDWGTDSKKERGKESNVKEEKNKKKREK
jgi:DNA-directed RNA polymerase subunit E'